MSNTFFQGGRKNYRELRPPWLRDCTSETECSECALGLKLSLATENQFIPFAQRQTADSNHATHLEFQINLSCTREERITRKRQ